MCKFYFLQNHSFKRVELVIHLGLGKVEVDVNRYLVECKLMTYVLESDVLFIGCVLIGRRPVFVIGVLPRI